MSRKERHEFIAMLYEHSPHTWNEKDPPMFIQSQAELLMRYSATLHRLAEELCNGYQDEKRTALAEKKQERIEQRAAQVAAAIGGKVITGGDPVITGGDPRGCVLKIVFPDGYTNDWGKEGICVPA